MPLDILSRGKPIKETEFDGNDRYATDPYAASIPGQGNFTVAQKDTLGKYSVNALMKYKDFDAYFCHACWYVFGVTCPKCGAESEKRHFRPSDIGKDDPLFEVQQYPDYEESHGLVWVTTTCRKCSTSFRVLKK
jgi:hypothetical protein